MLSLTPRTPALLVNVKKGNYLFKELPLNLVFRNEVAILPQVLNKVTLMGVMARANSDLFV